MASPRFKIVYCGELKPGVRAQQAINEFVSRFKVSEVRARKLILGGKKTTLKKDVDADTAETFRVTLEAVGLVVRIEPMVPPRPVDMELIPQEPVPGSGVPNDYPDTTSTVFLDQTYDWPPPPPPTQPAASSAAPTPPPEPKAEPTEPSPSPGDDDGGPDRLTGPHARRLAAGWSWIAKGFWHFKQDPWPWIGAVLILYVLTIAIGLIPLVGTLATTILGPVLTGGLMMGARAQDKGRNFRIEHLFAGFSDRAGQLALIGVIYLVGGILIAAFIGVWVSGALAVTISALGPSELGQADPSELFPVIGPSILLPTLVALLLAVPLAMALFLAPPLVALDGLKATSAMKLSFLGCLKNILPFLLYGLTALLLILLGSLPLLLGLLVVSPVLIASLYAAYRDIFFDAGRS